jgi:hypothetical protein
MSNDNWRDERRELNRFGRLGLGWWLIIVLVGVLVSGALWGLGVLLSGPRGVGDAIVEKNSAENWTAAQARFEDLYQEILASDRRIDIAYDAKTASPDDRTAEQTYTGTLSYCTSVVAQYNAEARKFLSEEFRAANLPAEISNTNPATDCKETLR